MKRKLIRFSSIAASIAFLTVFFGAAVNNTPETEAISATDFKAGNIISDEVFYNKNAMTVAEIQAHLNRYMPACDTWGTGAVGSGRYINGRAVPTNTSRAEYARQMRAAGKTRYHAPPYVCVQNYYENPNTHETLYETNNVIKDGMLSSAQIIYNAAQKYNVNPQVLLVMLKKESYVWGDNWPLKDEYNTVMGYACPDTAPCDAKYFGFYNQVEMAAWQLKYYKEHIYSYNYRPYATNYIQYSPDASCGKKSVYLENYATTSLYIYTPYTPNDAALRNYPGTATCGSYGNRNFFMYFSEWFGDTHKAVTKKTEPVVLEPIDTGPRIGQMIPDGDYLINSAQRDDFTLGAFGSTTVNGAGVGMWSKIGGTAQNFNLKYDGERDAYLITNIATNSVIDITSGYAANGKNTRIYTRNDSCSQYWKIIKQNDNYIIASYCNVKFVLGTTSSSKGASVNTYEKNGSKSQEWKFEKIEKETKTKPEQAIPDGDYLINSAQRDDFTLGAFGSTTVNGAGVGMWSKIGGTAQNFNLKYDGERDAYLITNIATNSVIDITSGYAANGKNTRIYTRNDSCSQYWKIIKQNDNYIIASYCNVKFVLGTTSSSKGASVNTYEKDGSKSQEWKFEKIEKETKTKPEQAIPDGDYLINSAQRDDFTLGAFGSTTVNGAGVGMWSKIGGTAQNFNLKYDGERDAYLITNIATNSVIDITSGYAANGKNTRIYTRNDSCSQYWKIIKQNDNYIIASYCNVKFVLGTTSSSKGASVNTYEKDGSKSQEWKFEKIEKETKTKPEQAIPDGDYLINSAQRDDFTLGAFGSTTVNGAGVGMWSKIGGTAQNFNLKYDGERDAYLITNIATNSVIDITSGYAANGKNTRIYTRNDSCSQYWKIIKQNDNYIIASYCNVKFVLGTTSSSKGASVNTYEKNGSKSQEWKFEKI